MRAGTLPGPREKAAGKKSCRSILAPSKPQFRSKLTNQGTLLPDVDGRSGLARRFRDIVAALASDQGGADRISETRLHLIRRFAGASALAERIEADMALGKPIDIATYATLISTAVRVAQRIGIDRRVRTVVPDLAEYLEGKAEPVA
jgi:hypothetical protein